MRAAGGQIRFINSQVEATTDHRKSLEIETGVDTVLGG
jgi:hypothetical protein